MALGSTATTATLIVSTDFLIGIRAGGTVKFTPGSMASQNANAVAITGGTISITTLTATSLDISGDIDVDGVTNLDVVDIDGAFTQDGGAVFNEGGVDADFRVESDTNTHALFVEGSSGNVGIGTANPTSPLVLSADADSADLMINIGNNKYSSANATGESKIKFGWANHTAANIAAYKETVNRTGFKLYGEVGWNVESLALTVSSGGDLTPAGGIYLGGTVAANKLDDYEEGTWTPTLEGSTTAGNETYTTQIGTYEKIGRQVTARCRVTLLSLGTLAGNVSIEGLPFPSSSSASTYGSVTFGSGAQLSLTAGTGLTGYVQINDTSILVQRWSATTGTAALTDSNLTNTSQFIISAVYMV